MRFTKYICILAFIISAVSCFNNSDLTSPDARKFIIENEDDSLVVSLKFGQSVIVNDKLILKFDGVTSDSRCPTEVNCVWEGDGEVKLILSKEKDIKEIFLHTTLEPKYVEFDDYKIVLKSLNPYPKSLEQIKPEDYGVEIVIKYLTPGFVKQIRLIDGADNTTMKRDMLSVGKVSLDKDVLNFDVSYSGGCKEHEISLFAYKEIMKSNPAQVTVALSHEANSDNCKALINRKVKFDLSDLKNYLKTNFNIQDKVILLLFDPSGKPLRSTFVEYNF